MECLTCCSGSEYGEGGEQSRNTEDRCHARCTGRCRRAASSPAEARLRERASARESTGVVWAELPSSKPKQATALGDDGSCGSPRMQCTGPWPINHTCCRSALHSTSWHPHHKPEALTEKGVRVQSKKPGAHRRETLPSVSCTTYHAW